jgi:MFS family permease
MTEGGAPRSGIVAIIYCRHPTTILVLFNASLISSSFYSSGASLTILDLFPDDAGAIMGIDNALNNVPGFLGPMVAGVLLDRGGCSTGSTKVSSSSSCAAAWQQLWWLSAALYLLGTLVYVASYECFDYRRYHRGDATTQRDRRTDNGRRSLPIGARLCDRWLFGK